MRLETWATRWGVPFAALQELRNSVLGLDWEPGQSIPGRSEAAIQNDERLAAAKRGGRLWRNNVGAMVDPNTGQFVRFGLCNETAQINARIKSSDLIGLQPVLITPAHVGHTFGQFTAREVKAGGWRYTGTPREQAQLAFITLVNSLGGDAKFTNGA